MVFCFVPGCDSGYPSQRKAFRKSGKRIPSIFSCTYQDDVEKWNRAIPRADRVFSAKDKVCELHFDANDIERYYTHKFPDYSIQFLKRGKPLLKPGSIPTIFPNLPERFSKKLQKQNEPNERVSTSKKVKCNPKSSMPSHCVVPRCVSNYKKETKASVFRFPVDEAMKKKWIAAIPRQNLKVTNSSRVCELHFLELDFRREASAYNPKTGKRISCKLNAVRLKKDAVPSQFPNCPSYMSRKRCRRVDPEERRIRLENEQLQNAVQQSVEKPTGNQDESANAVTTFLVPVDIFKQMSLSASNSLHWNKNELTALIALYQSEKCLYDRKHEHYYDLHERNKACEKIKNVLANMNFICTVQQIKNKIASLRSTYATEKAYKDRCIQAGQFTEDTYAPTMWCFGLLQFLDDYIEPNKEMEIKAELMEEDLQEIQILNPNVDLNIKMEPEEISNVEGNETFKINSSFSLNTDFSENHKDLMEEKEAIVCNENKIDSDDVNSREMKSKIKMAAADKLLKSIKIFSQDSGEKEDIFGEYIASEMKTLRDNPLLYMQTKQAIINVLTNANFYLLNPEENILGD